LSAEKKDLPMDIFYSTLASFSSLMGQIFLNKSFKYEDATKIAITKTIDVFFSFVLQFFLLDIAVDALSIVGAIAILVGTFFVLLFRLVENKFDDKKKKELESNENGAADKPKKSFSNTLLGFIFFKF
jgi:drug/metabolite transporter (DMT)-like permease